MELTKDQIHYLGTLLQNEVWKHESNLRTLALPREQRNVWSD